MFELLKEISKKKEYASIYSDEANITKFLYGRIIGVSPDEVAVCILSPDGRYDGVTAFKTSRIFRVEKSIQYSEKMNKLHSFCNEESIDYNLNSERIFESLLLAAKQREQIVSVEMLDSGYNDIVGFVTETENNLCEIKQIDEYGYNDGISCIKIPDITQVSCDSEDETKLLNLWKINYKKFEK